VVTVLFAVSVTLNIKIKLC